MRLAVPVLGVVWFAVLPLVGFVFLPPLCDRFWGDLGVVSPYWMGRVLGGGEEGVDEPSEADGL